jgi:hypothetical protein
VEVEDEVLGTTLFLKVLFWGIVRQLNPLLQTAGFGNKIILNKIWGGDICYSRIGFFILFKIFCDI